MLYYVPSPRIIPLSDLHYFRRLEIMTELQTSGDFGLPHIPDNLTIAQFMLDYQHEIRPVRGNAPCLIDDQSGNRITLETV